MVLNHCHAIIFKWEKITKSYNYVNEMASSLLMSCDYEAVNFHFSFILKYKFT